MRVFTHILDYFFLHTKNVTKAKRNRRPMSIHKFCLKYVLTWVVMLLILLGAGCAWSVPQRSAKVTDPTAVAQLLTAMNTWILPQPKEAEQLAETFDLGQCKGIRTVGSATTETTALMTGLAARLTARAKVTLATGHGAYAAGYVMLGVFADGQPAADFHGITAVDLQRVGSQGYVLHVDHTGVTIAAKSTAGLFYGTTTLVQIASDRTALPGLHVTDWPSMQYRGAQQDVCRGQVPQVGALKQLADAMGEAKMNIMELYIEHTYKFPSHPDISPPEGISPAEASELFNYAAGSYLEVHPMFQTLGHSNYILALPQYQHLAIRQHPTMPWVTTFDIRKPEVVTFMDELIGDLFASMPGKLFTVDITEIDYDALHDADKGNLSQTQITDLIFNYVVNLSNIVKKHGARLMVIQGPLDSTGSLSGLGPKLSQLPKDIFVGSYYCAGGPYQPAWKTDFPRLQTQGLDFFAQPWIYSHTRLMPWPAGAADFSDLEVGRGLQYGAIGSTTCDWGDEGHFHLVGSEWYSFLYHGASAWTGAKLSRDYFNQAYTRLLYGIPNDSVARAINLAGNINGQKVEVKNSSGQVVQQDSQHFYEFFGNPFTATEIKALADPVKTGQEILTPAAEAVQLLEAAVGRHDVRYRENLKQYLMLARCYKAMGEKLIARGHYFDNNYDEQAARDEMVAVADAYLALKSDFADMWLAEDKPNSTFDRFVGMFWGHDHALLPAGGKEPPIHQYLRPPRRAVRRHYPLWLRGHL